jgi:hypothetical protein
VSEPFEDEVTETIKAVHHRGTGDTELHRERQYFFLEIDWSVSEPFEDEVHRDDKCRVVLDIFSVALNFSLLCDSFKENSSVASVPLFLCGEKMVSYQN